MRSATVSEFRIQDTGVGIPEDQQTLIFTRFYRLHPAYEGQYPGAGLGLTVVKQFLEELSGEIHVKSTQGQGSTFSCLIPLRIPLSTGAKYTHPVTAPKLLKDLDIKNFVVPFKPKSSHFQKFLFSILVVEDHRIVQQVIKNLLRSLDVAVETADNSAQALQKIKLHDYSLITMDLGLPDQNGYEVTKKIHQWQHEQQRPLSLIVAISAHLDERERKRCLEIGMIRAYEKP